MTKQDALIIVLELALTTLQDMDSENPLYEEYNNAIDIFEKLIETYNKG